MIIGIDPGVKNIGVAVIDSALRVQSVHYWSVVDPEHVGYPNIVSQFSDLVNSTTNLAGDRPSIYIEKPFFTAMTLARNIRTLEVIGLLKYAAYQRCNITAENITMLSPASIKKQVTGNGRADKAAVIQGVKDLFKQTRDFNSHEADALAVAYSGYKLLHKLI